MVSDSAIKALGSLIKFSEVFLRDDASIDVGEVSSPVRDGGNRDVPPSVPSPGAVNSGVDHLIENGHVLYLEEMELAEQMSALGLPISFISQREKKNATSKGKRKGLQQRSVSGQVQEVSFSSTEATKEIDQGAAMLDASVQSGPEEELKKSNDIKSFAGIGDYSTEVSEVFGGRTEHSKSNSDEFDNCSHHTGFGDWCVAWDEFYQRNYFYNSKTSESTWDPPLGMDLSGGLVAKMDTSEVMSEDLCPGPLSDIQDNIDSLQNIANQLGNEELWRSDLSLQIMNAIADEVGVSECQGEAEANNTIREAKTLPYSRLNGEEGCDENYRANVVMEVLDSQQDLNVLKKKRKHKKRSHMNQLCNVNEGLHLEGFGADTMKYWCQRYRLFSRFDSGIKMDEEGWFSVTPESIAKHHASRCCPGNIIDCFTGVGGNAIQFAKMRSHVTAIDIDPQKIDYAQHNATVYGVADHIDFIKGDFFNLAPKLKGDTAFLSPPWGGPNYAKVKTYDISTMLKPRDGYYLFDIAKCVASRVIMFLPRNVDVNQLAQMALLAYPYWALEVEKNFLNGKLKAISAYFTQIQIGEPSSL